MQKDTDTADSAIHKPENTRPISMSSTDNKTMSNALACPLNEHIVAKLHSAQQGGIMGEQGPYP